MGSAPVALRSGKLCGLPGALPSAELGALGPDPEDAFGASAVRPNYTSVPPRADGDSSWDGFWKCIKGVCKMFHSAAKLSRVPQALAH